MSSKEIEKRWLKRIKPILVGAKITHVQYGECIGNKRPLEIILGNGVVVSATKDEECNDAGAYSFGYTDKIRPETDKAIRELGGVIPALGGTNNE
jgi:hypothetical protein